MPKSGTRGSAPEDAVSKMVERVNVGAVIGGGRDLPQVWR